MIEHEFTRRHDFEGSCEVADLPKNQLRNRYPDVKPLDETRVRLQQGGSDYINASLVSSKGGEAPWAFIVTQVDQWFRAICSTRCCPAAMLLTSSPGCSRQLHKLRHLGVFIFRTHSSMT